MGGSPSEKLTITDPLLNAFPQSSTTRTTIGVGHAAGVLKPVPMVVKTGSSFDAVHVAAALGVTANAMTADGSKPSLAEPAVAEMTSSRATVCELPSPNSNLIDAGYTPAVRLPRVAVTVIEAVCAAAMVPAAGVKVNQLGEVEATALKASGVDVRFAMVNA